jgi:DNA-binding response OmpR family regulator
VENQRSILVVEDEMVMNKVICYGLQRRGNYNVDCAYDGIEAIKKVEANQYDIILLDYHLPYKNGAELLDHIKKSGYTSKVVFLTSNTFSKDVIFAFKLGADEYIKKPVDMDELIVRLENVLRCKHSKKEQDI